MHETLDIVLLLALPASGKSEVRRFLSSRPVDEVRREFGLAPTVQLDDFPYVHLMRRVDEVCLESGESGVFFEAPDRSFRDGRDWGTLIALLNEDFRRVDAGSQASLGEALRRESESSTVADMLARIDRAAAQVGIERARLGRLPATLRTRLERELEADVDRMHADAAAANTGAPTSTGARPRRDRTLVIELARGGPEGHGMPLAAPFGYRYSLGLLDPEILRRATVLYVWVTPEMSREKNRARTDPNDPGSILHHGVPEHVMRNDYGCDDMAWLLAHGRRPKTIAIETPDGAIFDLPVGRFDNREDKTSFVRGEPKDWRDREIEVLRDGLSAAFRDIQIALAPR
ncbi:MAG: hypothetical protein IPK13_26350 [Deltaproteobacteria bacterium]|nr:hypothetical protein [Deltaproteobacteria bacterium]